MTLRVATRRRMSFIAVDFVAADTPCCCRYYAPYDAATFAAAFDAAQLYYAMPLMPRSAIRAMRAADV